MLIALVERAARQVAAEVDAADGRLLLDAESVAFVFGEPGYEGESRDRITQALSSVGIKVSPQFASAKGEQRVELSRQPAVASDSALDWHASVEAERRDQILQDAAFARSSRVLLLSGLVTVGLLVLYGTSGYWAYGAILAGVGIAALAITRYRSSWLLRVWYPRPKRRGPWAVALGVWPVVMVSALAGVFVIAPIDVVRDRAANRRAAEVLIQQANTALGAGQPAKAEALLTSAHHLSAHAPGLAAATSRVDTFNARRAVERADRTAYRSAKKAMAAKHYHRAITTLAALGAYRDASALEERYRTIAARAILAEAERVLATQPRGAIGLAKLRGDLSLAASWGGSDQAGQGQTRRWGLKWFPDQSRARRSDSRFQQGVQ